MKLTMREAIIHLVNDRELSKYRIAKELGVQPIMINKYLDGSRPRQGAADRMEDTYGIEVTNVYKPAKIEL